MPLDPNGLPTPDSMRGVIPYLVYAGRAGEAADFYARAFGAIELGRSPLEGQPGQYMHVQVEINGGALMMTDHVMKADPAIGASPMPTGHLQLVVGDGQAWWDRAVAAGCTVHQPYAMQFWGDEWGLLADPFGVTWGVLQPTLPAKS
jgi:PhnB protein